MADIERRWRLDQSDYLRKQHSGLARLYAGALRSKCLRAHGSPKPVPVAEIHPRLGMPDPREP
ncbi:MAG: hypothetical protein E5V33_16750 [Mesorhizobium sp.]|nr:MAG: hypothetical protein E5W30_11930 [Mesorhizobium sp.]TIX61851.1 MAG: hypothetical protein E5V33_16750 [Mesorhizobium sp.]